MMNWTLILFMIHVIRAQNLDQEDLKYKFRYFIKDDNTGDYKTQEESRKGDTVTGSYSVAEPNGDLRVVTYTADQQRGFNAHVQVHPGGSPMNGAGKEVSEEMKVHPRFLRRTGFNPFRPRSRKQSPEPEERQEEVTTEKVEEQSKNETPTEVIYVPTTASEGGTTVKKDMGTSLAEASSENIACNIQCTRINEKEKEPGATQTVEKTQHDETDGRAHIRPDEDKVQVEMEQIIRAEMQDPTSVKLGIPHYQHSKYQFPRDSLSYQNVPGVMIRDSNTNREFVAVSPVLYNSKPIGEHEEHRPKSLYFLPRQPYFAKSFQSPGYTMPYKPIPILRHQGGGYYTTYAPGIAIVMIPPQNQFQHIQNKYE